jgi:DNA-directed RNA polymerase subunit K/omega
MQVFTPNEIAENATNKYLAVLVAAKYARLLNEFPRIPGRSGEKKLTTRALEELSGGNIQFDVVARRRPGAEG